MDGHIYIVQTYTKEFKTYEWRYEGDSVNGPQRDTKRKTCDIRTWKKLLFLDISSTNSDTLVPSLCLCVETRSIEVFLSQPLAYLIGHHLRLSNILERISGPSYEPLSATNTSHRKQETFLYDYPLHWVLLPTKKRTTERCSSVGYSSNAVAILSTETSLWTCACASAT
jgi:hypothetical protein